jgi:hypothetical protein
MISFSDLTSSQRALLTVGGVVVGLAVGILLAASDFDFSVLTTLQTERLTGSGINTRYNPLGILGLATLVVAILGAIAFLVSWLSLVQSVGRDRQRRRQREQAA